MFKVRTLKNVEIQELKAFCQVKNIPGRTSETKAASTGLKYERYLELFEAQIDDPNASLNAEELDAFMFEQLCFASYNIHFMYRITNSFFEQGMTEHEVTQFLQGHLTLKLNQNLIDWVESSQRIDVATSRVEFDSTGELSNLHILMKIGLIEQQHGKTNFFCAVNIDLKSSILVIKLDKNQVKDANTTPLEVVERISDALKGEGEHGSLFDCLDLNFGQLNEHDALRTIYNLYAHLSQEAEKILNQRMEDDTVDRIEAFLKDIGVQNIQDDYIEQIKAVVYQDITSTMDEQIFKSGWVFKFRFREGDHSQASSRTDLRQPVYSNKAFWQLKELIHQTGELEEGGFHWNLNGQNPDGGFVDARLESKNGTIIVHFYNNTKSDRKEKEEFVIRKVGENL